MPYKVSFHPRFERDLKAFKKDKPVRAMIAAQVKAVIENPDLGEGYTANLSGLYKVSFGQSPQHRLLFRKYQCCQKSVGVGPVCPVDDPDVEMSECEGVVSFLFVKTREECNNLYKKGKPYFDETLHEGLSS